MSHRYHLIALFQPGENLHPIALDKTEFDIDQFNLALFDGENIIGIGLEDQGFLRHDQRIGSAIGNYAHRAEHARF